MNGILFPVKEAFSLYLKRWFDDIYVDTESVEEYASRSFDKAVMWAPANMVDAVEDMLKSYQKNNTTGVPGANAKFPMVIVAMAKDYTPSGGETGVRQMSRRLVSLSEEPGSSVYGYRQAAGDVRVQIVVLAAEPMSGQSIAAQLGLHFGEIRNRRFRVPYKWHQYDFTTPCMLETPDTLFSKVEAENRGMTILVADFTLKIILPFLDAPKPGEANDGTDNDPPGYPVVTQALVMNKTTGYEKLIMEPVDRTELVAALAAAEALVEAEYTPESWAVLSAAVAAGEAINDNPEEPQRIVSGAANAIQAAIAALVPVTP